MPRPFNFSAGPCCLPDAVLETAKSEMLNFKGTGMDVMEMSHRSKVYEQVVAEAEKDFRDIMNVPSNYKILFMGGGASLQFACVPLNLLGASKKCEYLTTGQWSEKAAAEARKYCPDVVEIVNTKDSKYTTITEKAQWKPTSKDSAYVHYCANETVNGVEFQGTPEFDPINILVGDHSSNFMTRDVEWSKHGVIYGGAQKNLGPAGLTFAVVRDDLLGSLELPICPTMCSYKTIAKSGSMYNTPPCHAIYMMGLGLKYTKEKGGLGYWKDQTAKKSDLLYGTIDGSDGFYSCPVVKGYRSQVNVPFVIKGGDEALEKKFLAEAETHNLLTLAGHRSVGGIRASMYNGMPLEGVAALTDFMKEFQQANQ